MQFDGDVAILEVPTLSNDGELGLQDAAGPGWYRVRVHARGRDEARNSVEEMESPLEEHLVQLWPGPPGPRMVHKLTDAYGRITAKGSLGQ